MSGALGGVNRLEKFRAVPIFPIVREAYRIWFYNFSRWLGLAVVPVACVCGLAFLESAILFDVGKRSITGGIAGPLFSLGYAIVQVPLITAWHRVVLIPDEKESHRLRLGSSEWRYLKSFLLLVGCSFLVMLVLGAGIGSVRLELLDSSGNLADRGTTVMSVLTFIFPWVGLGVLVLVFGRVLLRLPAAAIGYQFDPPGKRLRLKGNRLRILGIYVIAYSPIPILSLGTAAIFDVYESEAQISLANEFGRILIAYLPGILFLPVLVAVLSLIYRHLTKQITEN
jgi:hypothetical protein